MIGIDDTAHFEAIEKRTEELMKLVYGTKAGFNPNQARNEDGTWGSGYATREIWKSESVHNIKDFENEIRNKKNEVAGVYYEDGKFMTGAIGNENSVSFDGLQQGLIKARGSIFTHNHPGELQNSFSLSDIKAAFGLGLDEIRAVTKDNNFIMKINRDEIMNVGEREFESQYDKEITSLLIGVSKEANEILNNVNNKFTQEKVVNELQNQLWYDLAGGEWGEKYFEYKRERL